MNFRNAARAANLVEDAETGEFIGSAAEIRNAIQPLTLEIKPQFETREWAVLTRSARLIAKTTYQDGDETPGPRFFRKNKRWCAFLGKVSIELSPDEVAEIDTVVRKRVADGKALGWSVRQRDGAWLHGFDSHEVGCALKASGYDHADILKGHCCKQPWQQKCIPFEVEEPGDRVWNLDAPQYAYTPVSGDCPHWQLVLDHCGKGLGASGADYLLHWTARMLREPLAPLPYLFLFSATQNNGKSTFHEALSLLLTKGVARADRALTSEFNGELANAVLAIIEEKDISLYPGAYNRIKDLVTSPMLSVRRMRTDQYTVPNTLHFIQTANDPGACPVFPGDSRIVMIHVPDLQNEIPKPLLLAKLREEAPAFMHRVLSLELPPPVGRLALPIPQTEVKLRQMEASVGDFARAVAEYMETRTTAKLFARDFETAFGPGDWPANKPQAAKEIAKASAYLKNLGIVAEFGTKEEHGVPMLLTKH